MAQVTLTVNGKQAHRRGRAAHAVGPLPARTAHADRQPTLGATRASVAPATVLVDGRSAKACTLFAVQADGSEVTTIEGLADGDALHPLQHGRFLGGARPAVWVLHPR